MPDPKKVFDFLEGKKVELQKVTYLAVPSNVAKIKYEKKLQRGVVVFHKIDKVHVLDQIRIFPKAEKVPLFKKLFAKRKKNNVYEAKLKKDKLTLIVYKPEGVKYSTLVINGELTEIEWKE